MIISTPHFTPLKFPSSLPPLCPCPTLFIFSLIFDDPLSPINVAVYTWLHGHSQEHRKIRVEMPSKENNCPSPVATKYQQVPWEQNQESASPSPRSSWQTRSCAGDTRGTCVHVAATSHAEDSVSLHSSSPSGFQISLPPFRQHPLSLGRTGSMVDEGISFSAEQSISSWSHFD